MSSLLACFLALAMVPAVDAQEGPVFVIEALATEPQPAAEVTRYYVRTFGYGRVDYGNDCDDIETAKNQAIGSATDTTYSNWLDQAYTMNGFYYGPGLDPLWASATYAPARQHVGVDLTGKGKADHYVAAYFACKVGYAYGAQESYYSCDASPQPLQTPLMVGAQNSIDIFFLPGWVSCPAPPGAGCKVFYAPCSPEIKLVKQVKDVRPSPDTCEANVGPQPLNVMNGNASLHEPLFHISTPGLPLEFAQSYNSASEETAGPLGPKWANTYAVSLASSNTVFNGTNNLWKILKTGSGEKFWFQQNTNTGTYSSPFDNNYELAKLTNDAYEMTIPARVVYSFDTNGVLQQIRDLFNNRLTLTYTNNYPTQLLTKVEHSSGKSLTFSYTSNLLTRIDTPSTNLSGLFSYNGIGELTGLIRRLSSGDLKTGYAYDYATNWSNHSLTQRVDAAGRVAAWAYATNDQGQITSRGIRSYHPDGTNALHDTIVSYNTNLNLSTVTYVRDNTNLVYEYSYNPVLLRIEAIHGPNWTNPVDWKGTRHGLDDYGNVTSTLTADWALLDWTKSVKAYDAKHHVTNRASAYKAVPTNFWRYLWDTNSQTLTSTTDPEGREVRYEYTNGLIAAQKLVYSATQTFDTTYSYDTNGLLAAVTNANGHWVRYVRGGCCPDEITPQEGPRVILEYDTLKHLIRREMPGETGARNTLYSPDELGRVLAITYPDGLGESFSYDPTGNLLTNVDRAGRATRYGYTADEQLASITRTLIKPGATQDVATSFTYDSRGNLVKLTDPAGRAVKSYTLDAEDRPTKITNVESQEMTIVYGLGNSARSISRFDGTEVTNSYEAGGRLSVAAYPGTTNFFTYYANGLLKTARNEAGTISNVYDNVNRLIACSQPVPSGQVQYTYYPAGNISSVVSVAGTTVYSYDAAERVTSIAAPEGTYTFAYNTNNGLLATMHYPNNIECRYGYDVMDRTTNIAWYGPASNVLRSFAYSHGTAGMITNILRENGERTAYAYDSLDQLREERYYNAAGELASWSGYQYDLVGNRTQKTGTGGTVSYSYGTGDRLTGWSIASTGAVQGFVDVFGYASEAIGTNAQLGERTVNSRVPEVSGTNFWVYDLALAAGTQQIVAAIGDAAGNVGRVTNTVVMKVVTNASYQFDLAGDVTSIVYATYRTLALSWDGQYRLTAVKTNGAVAETYAYDAHGNRISIGSGTNTTRLVYDRMECTAETDASGTLIRKYTYAPGIDNVLSITSYGSTTNTYYYLKDHIGTVVALAASSGAILESYRYDAWGKVGAFDAAGKPLGESAIGNRILFQGRDYSWGSGLYWFRARWYDPIAGRWLSKDPRGEYKTQEFAALANNPTRHRDPTGCDETYLPLGQNDPPGVVYPRVPAECNSPGLDLLASSPECDAYGDEHYGPIDLRCFCKCAGNSPWSKRVRGCLRCAAKHGIEIDIAHFDCYHNADAAGFDRPEVVLACCLIKCGL